MNALQIEIAKSLFRLAWADGQIEQREVDLIDGLLTKIGMPLAERLAFMDEGLSVPYQGLPNLDAVLPDRESRLFVLEQLIAISFSGGHSHPKEMELLANLSTHWGVSADELAAMRQKERA